MVEIKGEKMSLIAIDARKIKSSTGRYVHELLKQLQDIDHTNTYKVLILPSDIGEFVPKNPNFEVLIADFKHYTSAEQLGFNNFLRGLKPDLVHFYMPQQPLLYTRPAVTTVHDLNLLRVTENDMGALELSVKKAVFAFLLRRVAYRTKHIFTPTHFTKNDLVKWSGIKPGKVTVTYLGVPHTTKVKPIKKYTNTQFIMYLGRAEPYKNNRRLIEAHQELIRTKPELKLLIIGAIDDLRKADIAWVQEHGYKNVDFLGWRSDQEAAWLHKHTLAFVNPSYMEGFGLPALEAMGHGAAVVNANTTCSPEVLGDAAHYFDPLDIADMTRAIREVIDDQKLRKKLITNAAVQVKKYSWRTMAEQTHSTYLRVLAG
jgi:glycosyltransferase involved in cell wall biosynthesis